MSEATFPFPHNGVFTIGTGALGAQKLQAFLSVPFDSSSVVGYGVLTQPTSPPLSLHSAFHGVVHTLGFGEVKQIFALQGTAVPPLLGAPHVTQLTIALDAIWGNKGKASYTYVTGAVFHTISDQPITVRWLLLDAG